MKLIQKHKFKGTNQIELENGMQIFADMIEILHSSICRALVFSCQDSMVACMSISANVVFKLEENEYGCELRLVEKK